MGGLSQAVVVFAVPGLLAVFPMALTGAPQHVGADCALAVLGLLAGNLAQQHLLAGRSGNQTHACQAFTSQETRLSHAEFSLNTTTVRALLGTLPAAELSPNPRDSSLGPLQPCCHIELPASSNRTPGVRPSREQRCSKNPWSIVCRDRGSASPGLPVEFSR